MMLGELRDDFDRWWVSATFNEKMSMAVTITIMVCFLGSTAIGILRSFPRNIP